MRKVSGTELRITTSTNTGSGFRSFGGNDIQAYFLNYCTTAFGWLGDSSPSEADFRLTRRISEAVRILQIQLLDHVIIGQPMNDRQGYFSFMETGALGLKRASHVPRAAENCIAYGTRTHAPALRGVELL
jgi:RadC-like JAB domain